MLKNNNCNEQKLEMNVLVGINAYFGGTNTYQLTLAKKMLVMNDMINLHELSEL